MEYENQPPVYEKKKRKGLWLWFLVAALFVLSLSILLHFLNFPAIYLEKTENGLAVYLGRTARQAMTPAPAEQLPVPAHDAAQAALELQPAMPGAEKPVVPDGMSLQAIYETVLPSVVTVTAQTRSGTAPGTGVIMSADGYIITNQHVVADALQVQVQLWDGTAWNAAVVGSDMPSDLAVLQIAAEALVPATFGNSESLRVGDAVVAIGTPFAPGLQSTMANGIVAGISRDLTVSGRKMDLLQTTAVPLSDSPGGPLLNGHGQVIGISAVKLQGAEGMGFAVPMATVKPIVEDLIERGYVSGRPAIGIAVEAVPMRARVYFGLPEGAYVAQVDPYSDAFAQGLREGDVITALEGQAVAEPGELAALKDQYAAGDTVTLTVFRGGELLQMQIRLMDRASEQ